MFVDVRGTGRAAFDRTFDVCVIGAGPAGITLARRLAARGRDVALMEAGPLDYSEESQAIYRGENVGLDYFPLDLPRLRYFGGASNHWAGWCRALEAHDFEPKPFNPLSGWPIRQADLDPYRADADAILDLPPTEAAPDLPVRGERDDFRRIQFRWSPPTHFPTKFGDELKGSARILLAVNANLVDLRLDEAGTAVTEARFRSFAPEDEGFAVRARGYCLCAGGIENARLLLNFRTQAPDGIGNAHGLVGRFFCEHPHFVLADLALAELPPEIEFYAPTRAFIQARRTLNFGLRLEPGPPVGSPCSASAPCPPADLRARFPAVGRIRIAHEQALNPHSRVLLGPELDALGMRRVRLDWRLTDLDLHTMRASVMAFAKHLAAEDVGRARIRDWLLEERVEVPGTAEDEVGGKHHMCTTRMADDPRRGVVDADCRVHGMRNLHVAGSSVFATGGHANPTYTLVQLALRLGDHLAA